MLRVPPFCLRAVVWCGSGIGSACDVRCLALALYLELITSKYPGITIIVIIMPVVVITISSIIVIISLLYLLVGCVHNPGDDYRFLCDRSHLLDPLWELEHGCK